MKKTGRRAVFLDRDGTIIYDRGYLRDPEQVQLLPGAGEALSRLRKEGFYLVLVSNQSGIGRGLMTSEDLKQVHRRLVTLLAKHSVRLDGVYYCPHAPWEGCICRKPAPGMLLRAADELGINLTGSFMVGDKSEDIEAGKRAGCRTILIGTGQNVLDLTPDYLATSWTEVTHHILDHVMGEKRER